MHCFISVISISVLLYVPAFSQTAAKMYSAGSGVGSVQGKVDGAGARIVQRSGDRQASGPQSKVKTVSSVVREIAPPRTQPLATLAGPTSQSLPTAALRPDVSPGAVEVSTLFLPPALRPSDLTPPIQARIEMAPLTGDQLFNHARENVFKLVFREKGATSETGHGSAFAIRKNGYMITNFHVVAEAVEKSEKFEMALEKDNQTLPVKIVTIDAVNDLALVKVETEFPRPLEIKFASASVPGEAAYSFGFPHSEGFSMAQGNLNGERLMGFGTVLSGTMPINPGMSGGPCLNVYGQIVGVNRAIQLNAQNISYFSPWGALRAIADHARQFHEFKSDEWRAYAVDQIERQEKKSLTSATVFATSAATNAATSAGQSDVKIIVKPSVDTSQKFGHLRFHAPFDAGCGQSNQNEDGKTGQSIFICRGVSLSLLGEDRTALNVTTFASSSGGGIVGKLTSLAAGALVESRYEQIKAQNYRHEVRSPSAMDLHERCSSKNIRNGNGLFMTVRFCSLALDKFNGLYTTALRIEQTNKKGESVSFGQLFEGMTMPATLKLMQYFIESLEESKP